MLCFIDQVELQKPSHVDTKPARKFFIDKQNSWGVYQFIKLEDLEQQHLKDDCFTVRAGRAPMSGSSSRLMFAVHRCVLVARSPVFSAELYGTMKEGAANTAIMEIDDMN
ncbi:hypothetical protein PR202_gb07773 [Eleusine coracana subsp. coracana]|uniref:MATH domain-containing protein n=1 Tax=Eleusine coracana subsp. coracana TaxID=191504 RepID=A0AAV5EAH4_ELECO|nr:hypothetical protein PR202_gb07773 [Eleusine coracana subsp. coracana]